jgi:hypothetical protein
VNIPVAPGTDRAQIAVGIRIPLDLPQTPVFYIGKDGATVPAAVAEGGTAIHRCAGAGLSPFLEVEDFVTPGARIPAPARALKSPSVIFKPLFSRFPYSLKPWIQRFVEDQKSIKDKARSRRSAFLRRLPKGILPSQKLSLYRVPAPNLRGIIKPHFCIPDHSASWWTGQSEPSCSTTHKS